MKKLTINTFWCFIILICTQFCQAQYLSFDELLSLRAKELDDVNDYLIKKKWEIDNAKEGDYEEYSHATWAFNKNHYESKARAWVSYLYADGFTNIVRYMTTSSSHHDLIKARIKASGFKLSDKAIEENGLAFTYTNGQRSIKVTTDKDEDGVARFVFTIRKNIASSSQSSSTNTSARQTTTPKTSTVRDVDGNIYKTVQIGTQTWITENLKTTKYNDETVIPLITEDNAWAQLTSPRYFYYNNENYNKDIYGALYNWHTVATGKLCPKGYHVPTNADWNTLVNYLGNGLFEYGEYLVGGNLKSNDSMWNKPNDGATNESGFSALPTGCLSFGNDFTRVGIYGMWWSATESSQNIENAFVRKLNHSNTEVVSYEFNKSSGVSVRCLKD